MKGSAAFSFNETLVNCLEYGWIGLNLNWKAVHRVLGLGILAMQLQPQSDFDVSLAVLFQLDKSRIKVSSTKTIHY